GKSAGPRLRTRMFAMSHSTRLLLCRLGFVLLCALPTAAVGIWIVGHRLLVSFPAPKAEGERELTSRLGLPLHLDSFCYPRAGVAELSGCRLLAPNTEVMLARIDRLTVRQGTSGWELVASQLSIDASRLRLLRDAIEERLLRGTVAVHSGNRAVAIRF